MGSTPIGGGLALANFTTIRCLSCLGFPSAFKSSEGPAPLSRWTYAFRAPISTDSFGRKSRNADPRERHPAHGS
jgi:hypothetical protein